MASGALLNWQGPEEEEEEEEDDDGVGDFLEPEDSDDEGGCSNSCAARASRPVVLATCWGGCCVILLVILGVLSYVGYTQVSLKYQRANEQDPHITPEQYPRYFWCAGCPQGYKTDAQLRECLKPCASLGFILAWELLAKEAGYKLVYFPSRPGPKGEPSVNISAWWMPPPASSGVVPQAAPRVVALHGLASNCNHCAVQATCFLLRELGYGCLTPSVRDFGLSGASTHPAYLTWGYDYHLDLLGAWDYAVNDPDGILGGAVPEDQVGIMGFSKGALGAATAFGLEERIQAAWLDSGPYSGLHYMVDYFVRRYAGPMTPLISKPVYWAASYFTGGRVDLYDPLKLLANCSGRVQRHVLFSQGLFDSTVPLQQGQEAITLLSGLKSCYAVTVYTPPEYCNGGTHHQEMWEFPADTRMTHCKFWRKAFRQTGKLCNSSPQAWSDSWVPPSRLPPGTPELPE